MEWFEKIAEGMRLMKEGCQGNPSWTGCRGCPFDDFCDILNEATGKIPSEFTLIGEDDEENA